MRLRDRELHGLPVRTAAGVPLGTVAGVELDVAAHVVACYVVARVRSLRSPLPGELLVAPTQVLSLDAEAMTVADLAVPDGEPAVVPMSPVEPALTGTSQSTVVPR